MARLSSQVASALLAVLLLAAPAGAEDAPSYLASIRRSPELQQFLDHTVERLMAGDPALRRADVRIALLDLSSDPPTLADRRGGDPIYPASVIKFIYLMAAYAWEEQGRRAIDPEMDRLLREMIHDSSNRATQGVFARLTRTEPGPELSGDAYADFAARRLAVNRWLAELGITDLHCANPTYDGDGDLYGRDRQFVSDRSVRGALPAREGELGNRNAMTAIGTAKALALLATDRALTPAGSEAARRRMKRDLRDQPHLAHRIAGGAARLVDLEVFSKSGTWDPIYADAGIVRNAAGRQFVLAVFTQGTPPYRGDFIADLTESCAAKLLSRRVEP